jgi:hypothetical protein
MTPNSYIVIVIPENKEKQANKDADKIDSGKTSKTFTVKLSQNGKLPNSHRWCSWWMNVETELPEIEKDFDGKPNKDGKKHKERVFNLSEGWTADSIKTALNLKTIEPPPIVTPNP